VLVLHWKMIGHEWTVMIHEVSIFMEQDQKLKERQRL
jgi:hypothetical protein